MLVLEVTLLRTTANCQGDRLFRGVAANAVEGVVCIASRQNRNRLQKTAITPSIPLGSELMAVVSPQGPLPMLDNPNLQASYFMTSHHHAATKPYAQGHESRVGIEKKNPSTVGHINETSLQGHQKRPALQPSCPFGKAHWLWLETGVRPRTLPSA